MKLGPGLKACEIEISTSPQDPTSWKRLKGTGLRRQVSGLPAGTYTARACSVRADTESDYTVSAPITIK